MSDAEELDELIDEVRAHATEVAGLDGPRAEAWASDVLALVAELSPDPVDALIGALDVDDPRDRLTRAAVAAIVDEVAPSPSWDGAPAWASALGTSRCERAWVLESRGAASAAFRFVDAADVRHVLTVDLLPGPPERVGEVAVGPGELLDALEEEDAAIEAVEDDPGSLARRVAAALVATDVPRESAVVNGRLVAARLASITGEPVAAPVAAPDEVPAPPPRDPETDAWALDVVLRAAGPVAPDLPDDLISFVADQVAPADLAPFDPAVRDAILLLEWADWLGAVIGLVREGAGAPIDGDHLVDLVNRCPEVTTTIPAGDRRRIAWAFSTLAAEWAEVGLVADGTVTDLGVRVLPAALVRAWSQSPTTAA